MEYSTASFQTLHSFFHIAQAITKRTNIIFIKTGTIVVNIDHQVMIGTDSDAYLRSLGMFHHIVQSFFYSKVNITPEFSANRYCRELFRLMKGELNPVLRQIF